jgi:hypothetical protein
MIGDTAVARCKPPQAFSLAAGPARGVIDASGGAWRLCARRRDRYVHLRSSARGDIDDEFALVRARADGGFTRHSSASCQRPHSARHLEDTIGATSSPRKSLAALRHRATLLQPELVTQAMKSQGALRRQIDFEFSLCGRDRFVECSPFRLLTLGRKMRREAPWASTGGRQTADASSARSSSGPVQRILTAVIGQGSRARTSVVLLPRQVVY